MRELELRFAQGRGYLVARHLTGCLQRLRGLLFSGPGAEPVVLEGCSSIHTFGMAYRIDAAFLGEDGRCLLSAWRIPQGRILSAPGAQRVVERPSSDDVWPMAGELVEAIELCKGAETAQERLDC